MTRSTGALGDDALSVLEVELLSAAKVRGVSLEGVLRDGNLTEKTTLSELELESAATYFLLLIVGYFRGTVVAALFPPCVFFWRRREDLSPDGWESPSNLAIFIDFTTDKFWDLSEVEGFVCRMSELGLDSGGFTSTFS